MYMRPSQLYRNLEAYEDQGWLNRAGTGPQQIGQPLNHDVPVIKNNCTLRLKLSL